MISLRVIILEKPATNGAFKIIDISIESTGTLAPFPIKTNMVTN